MDLSPCAGRRERARNLLFLGRPALWPAWPFLSLVRRRDGRPEELGLLFDALHAVGVCGHAATVFRCNLFALPPALDQMLGLPREVHDTAEEVYDAGWRVD